VVSLIAFFDEITLDDTARVGGKGANLGHLTRAGYDVPPGFCVLASAYDAFISSNDLEPRIMGIIGDLHLEDLEAVEAGMERVRGLIECAEVPPGIEDEIREAYRRLIRSAGVPDARALVAVRSSVGTRDLSATSFPGQMDTYHNVRGEDDVIDKVSRCWASAFSYSATVNRRARGIDHMDVFVAPLVQMMVQPETAGVVFTANPLNGRRDQMVVNSCLGVGEGVVSGEVEADHLVLDRETLEVLEETTGDKRVKFVLDEGSGCGILRVAVEGEEARSRCLTSTQVADLGATAREIDELYGRPQDVEWAYEGGRLYILQSRAASMPDVEEAGADGAHGEWVSEFDSTVDPEYPYYTLANISEVLPGVLTPISVSGIKPLDLAFIENNRNLGLMKGIEPSSEYTFLGIFYGRAHINLSVILALTAKLPVTGSQEFDRMLAEDDERRPKYNFRWTPGAILTLVDSIARSVYQTVKTPLEASRAERSVKVRVERGLKSDFETMPYERYAEWIRECEALRLPVYTLHISASQFSVVYHDLLKKLTARWLDDPSGALASRLVTGLQTLESARPSERIWDLSRIAAGSAELVELFETNEQDEVLPALLASGSEAAGEFMAALGAFLADYGYRSVFEAEMMLPNWETDPSYVFAMIKNYMGADPSSSPRTMAGKQQDERNAAMAEARGRLGRSRRVVFDYILEQAHRYITLREFMKSVLAKELAQTKKEIHVMSRRYAADGFIAEPGDFYFLTMDEIEAIARGKGAGAPVDALVERRRLEYERNQVVVLPEYSRGRPRPMSARELESRSGVEVLSGIAVSPGVVTGRARVITDPRRNSEIEPGEILVAPVTDAAWTPLFVTAGAIVVDIGGPLSHGSIVAREFGIPGVLSVGAATRLIRNGQVITVDGDEGKVYLHPA